MTTSVELRDTETGSVLLSDLRLAINFWTRFRGMQLAPKLNPTQGLLLAPCASVHMCFVFHPLHVFFCNADGVVISSKLNARPWISIAADTSARFVIETSATDKPTLRVGQSVRIHEKKDHPIRWPQCLHGCIESA